VNVYLHIPFCKQICAYCGYLKIVDSNGTLQDEYVDVLTKEIEMFANILKDKNVKTLHFGGGTPSLLTPYQLGRLMKTLLKINPNILSTLKEVSIEATPGSIEYSKFSALKAL
jgi:oxygen-independent coproporphyrinogen-3 oxidase